MKKYISIMLITLAVAGGSCKKTYLSELAINPNTPAQTTPNLALAGALKITAGIVEGGGYNNFQGWDGYLSQSTGVQPILSFLAYSITTSTYDDFSNVYLNISNYNALLKSTTEPNYQAIAKIMIAYDFENLVDQYNNVPYTQALQGASNLTPAYDKGSDIYDDLMKQLDAAIVLIQKAPATAVYPGTADIMYGATLANGGMNKWIQFANTLKLRLAVRQSTAPSLAGKKGALTTAIQATSALGYISTSSEGYINPGYVNLDANGGDQSPIALNLGVKQAGGNAGSSTTYFANQYLINFFVGNGTQSAPDDPRLFQIFAPSTTATAGGAVVGTFLGVTIPPVYNGKTSAASKLSSFLINPTKSAIIFSASQSLFLQAEAVNVGYLTGNAKTLYTAGITASFIEDGLTTTQATAYEALPVAAWPATASAQEVAILTQKWAALAIVDPFEAYNEIRRTGIPNAPVSVYAGNSSTVRPSRIPYPLTEYNTNATNVGAQGTIDIFNSKIFWAQ